VQTPQCGTSYLLGYDQVGSLKAAAAMDGPQEGRVVKLIDYDAFGNILSDSNPNLLLPLAFAGGLRDRFAGWREFFAGSVAPLEKGCRPAPAESPRGPQHALSRWPAPVRVSPPRAFAP